MAKFCRNCGTKLAEGENFCPQCGTRHSTAKGINLSKSQSHQESINLKKPAQQQAGDVNMPMQAKGNGNASQPMPNSPAGGMNGTVNYQASNGNNMGKAIIAILLVLIAGYFLFSGNDDDKKPAAQEISQEVSSSNSKPDKDTGSQEKAKAKMMELVSQKDKLDVEIACVAGKINDYLGGHPDFKGADAAALISSAKDTLDKVETAQDNVRNLKVSQSDEPVREALATVLECEAGRIRGLYKGMLDSKNNGDYMIGFKDGTAAAYRFDDENAKLNQLLGR